MRTLAILALAVLSACSSEPVTTLEGTWVNPQPRQPFKKLLIISKAGDEFVQVAFQDQMAAALKARGMNAEASKSYFTPYSTDADAEKARFMKAIDDSGADFVLFARVTGTGTSARSDRYMTFGDATGLYTAYDRYVSVARSQSDYSQKTVTTEVSIFSAQGEKMIWSARIETANPARSSGTRYAPQYVEVVLDAMKKDRLF
jgi:hypothetical protein